MIIKNAYTDSEMLPYCESVANVSAAAGAAIFESREMICARMGITGLETVSRFASEAAAAIRDENVTALLLNKIIKWIGFCDAGTIFNAMDYFSRALAADREDALRIFAEFGESGFWEEAECEDNPGNIAEASNYIFSLMSAFKSRFAGLVSGCVALYKRRGVEGIDRVVSFVGGLSACGGGFSAAFIKNGAALVDGIGYEGVKRLAQYRAAFEGVSYEMTLGWIERCPDIIAALGYDWLDEITGIYLRTIGSNPEFGLALITKSNEIIERSGFDMLYAMVNNSGQLPAGHAGLAECWIEGCFKVAAAAGESGSGGGVAVLEKFARRTRELFDENHNRGSAFARGETESFSDFIVEIFDGLKLSRIKNVLAVYLEALLGAKLAIVEADSAYTDGVKIYLPSSVTEFRNKEMNFTLYKVLATHEEAHIEYGSFDFEMDAAAAACTKVRAKYGLEAAKDGCEVEKFCSLFPEPSMASYIFNMFEDFRIESRLVSEYPMLGRQIRQVNERLLTKRPRLDSLLSEKERTIEIILQAVLGRLQNASCSGAPAAILREMLPKIRGLRSASSGAHDSAALAAELYILIDEACAEPYEPAKPLSGPLNQAVVEGNIGNFKRASRELNRRLNRPRVPLAGGAEAGESGGNGTEKHDGERSQAKGAPSGKKGAGGASDEKVEKMLRELFKKRGVRPSEIEAAAANMDDESLRAYVSGLRSSLAAEEEESQKRGKSYPYPEWGSDIGEYRPNVALVHETECEPAPDDEFYAETVSKRRGLIKSVLREFKMIKPADNADRKSVV